MKDIAVVGSRDFPDLELVGEVLRQCDHSKLISGGAKGVDRKAEEYARQYNVEIEVIEPDWDQHGKSSGPIRNQEIINKAEHIIAFWNGESSGTKDSIKKALKTDKPVDVYVRKKPN